jgi:L-iditol 2-dehydrogenase
VKRAEFYKVEGVRLTEKARPRPDLGSVLVAVRACGLCTWEQRVYRGAKPHYPFAGGHEIGGVVVEAPGGEFPPGMTVAVSRLPRCRTCNACKSGKDNLCAYGTRAMSDPDGPGGLAEYVIASACDIAAVPARSHAEAALVEPLACVQNSLGIAQVGRGTRLAIIGNGFMGVLHARAAAAVGAHVTLLRTDDPAPAGLERAWPGESLDADDPADRPQSSAFDAVILIRDVVAKLPLAGDIARPGGVVSVFASLPVTEIIGLPTSLLRTKELRLTGAASHHERDFELAGKMVDDGRVRVDDLIHRRFLLADLSDALAFATTNDTGRVVVTIGPELNGAGT